MNLRQVRPLQAELPFDDITIADMQRDKYKQEVRAERTAGFILKSEGDEIYFQLFVDAIREIIIKDFRYGSIWHYKNQLSFSVHSAGVITFDDVHLLADFLIA